MGVSGHSISEGVPCKLTWKKPTRSKRMNLTRMDIAIESESMSGGFGSDLWTAAPEAPPG